MSDRRASSGPRWRARFARWRLAPDGLPRPDAPLGRGPVAARVLGRVIDGVAWIGARLPAGITHGGAVVGGHLEWALRPGKRRRLAANVAHAVGAPPASRIVRRTVRREVVNEARRSADLLWAIGKPEAFLATVDIAGREHAVAAARAGRGVLLAGIHLGGWEVAATVPAAIMPVPASVLVADNWLAWGIQHVRAAAGLRAIYRSQPALVATRLLQRGEVLVVLGDDASGAPPRRHLVHLAHGVADLPAGIVALARLTGAAIVPFSVLPLGRRRWKVTLEPAITVSSQERDAEQVALQELADRWTALITANPDQWAASFPIAWKIAP